MYFNFVFAGALLSLSVCVCEAIWYIFTRYVMYENIVAVSDEYVKIQTCIILTKDRSQHQESFFY